MITEKDKAASQAHAETNFKGHEYAGLSVHGYLQACIDKNKQIIEFADWIEDRNIKKYFNVDSKNYLKWWHPLSNKYWTTEELLNEFLHKTVTK